MDIGNETVLAVIGKRQVMVDAFEMVGIDIDLDGGREIEYPGCEGARLASEDIIVLPPDEIRVERPERIVFGAALLAAARHDTTIDVLLEHANDFATFSDWTKV
jgi:hypothetical protein